MVVCIVSYYLFTSWRINLHLISQQELSSNLYTTLDHPLTGTLYLHDARSPSNWYPVSHMWDLLTGTLCHTCETYIYTRLGRPLTGTLYHTCETPSNWYPVSHMWDLRLHDTRSPSNWYPVSHMHLCPCPPTSVRCDTTHMWAHVTFWHTWRSKKEKMQLDVGNEPYLSWQ